MEEDLKESEVLIHVTLDENDVPEEIKWIAGEEGDAGVSKAAFIQLWDADGAGQFHIDLWTKEMEMDEMKYFFFQNIMTMAEAFEKATNESGMAKEMKAFGKFFAEKMSVIPPPSDN